MKTRAPFDFIKDLTEKKTAWEDLPEHDRKAFNPFMMAMFFGMNPDLIEFVNDLQKYTIGQMKPREVYKLYLHLLPKMKLPFHKFIKGTKQEKYNTDLVQLFAKHHMVSQRIATEYLDMMTDAQIVSIIKLYGTPETEIKRLMK